MKFRLAYLIFFILLSFSCRKKIADDYAYYQPYKRDTTSVKKSVSPTLATVDSVQTGNKVVEKIKPVDLSDKYFIVVASFSVEEYALTMKNDLIKQGFEPEIFILNNDGWNKLAIVSYNNLEEATEAMNKIKLKGGLFSGARIVIK